MREKKRERKGREGMELLGGGKYMKRGEEGREKEKLLIDCLGYGACMHIYDDVIL